MVLGDMGPEHGESPLFAGVGVLCETATRLAGVDGAAVAVLMSPQSRELVYATDDLAKEVDEFQFTVGEGPCLDAFELAWPQLCPNLDACTVRDNWLAFSSGVREMGVGAVFAFPLPGAQHVLGVLELYRRTAGGLDDEQLNAAATCAEAIGHTILSNVPHSASAVEAAVGVEAASLHSSNPFNRSELHIAAGMVAVHLHVSIDEALSRIRAHAYSAGLTVSATAGEIVARRLTLQE
jgi:GAF domain